MKTTIHQALKLPTRYRVSTSITGHVRIGKGHHEQRLVELRQLRTDTDGQSAVYAVKVVNGDGQWVETTSTAFTTLAVAIVTGAEIEVQNKTAWGVS